MEEGKRKFIEKLIETAQESVWKNELARDFAQKFAEGKEKETKIKACEHAIKQDEQYISFLKEYLPENNITSTL